MFEPAEFVALRVNSLRALHPKRNAPADSALVDSCHQAGEDKAAHTAWLQRLREVCTDRGIFLIPDGVFLG